MIEVEFWEILLPGELLGKVGKVPCASCDGCSANGIRHHHHLRIVAFQLISRESAWACHGQLRVWWLRIEVGEEKRPGSI